MRSKPGSGDTWLAGDRSRGSEEVRSQSQITDKKVTSTNENHTTWAQDQELASC